MIANGESRAGVSRDSGGSESSIRGWLRDQGKLRPNDLPDFYMKSWLSRYQRRSDDLKIIKGYRFLQKVNASG